MNLFTAAWRTLTYRNEYTDPDRADGLDVSGRWWGARTVRHRGLPAMLEARRRLLLRGVVDAADMALMDRETADRLAVTAARMPDTAIADWVAEWLAEISPQWALIVATRRLSARPAPAPARVARYQAAEFRQAGEVRVHALTMPSRVP